MSKIDDQITQQRSLLAKHVEEFPSACAEEWRVKFDELRADLERLEFAKKHPVPYSGPIAFPLRGL